MKGFIYFFRKYPTASLLNIIGLSLAYAACYILLTQIFFQVGYNKCIDNWQNIYRIESKGITGNDQFASINNRPISEAIKERIPEVQQMALWASWSPYNLDLDGTSFMIDKGIMLPGTLEAMQAKLVDGTFETKTSDDGIFIPASLAQNFFGTTAAAGKYIKQRNDKDLVVRGVYEDFPDNCAFGNICYVNMDDNDKDNFGNYNYQCYVRLIEGADPIEVTDKINNLHISVFKDYFAANNWQMTKDIETQIKSMSSRLDPIDETYFSGALWDDKGNKGILVVMEITCFLLLIVAAINFTNFTLAESPMRIKSINTRKVLGSSNAALRLSFMSEGLLISVIAFILAILYVSQLSLIPSIGNILQGTISAIEHWGICLSVLGIAIAIGIFTTSYPAWYVTSFAPAMVLKGSFGLSPKGRFLRTMLICFQFVVSFFMVAYLSILIMQSRYLHNSNYGFDKDQILSAMLFPHVSLEQANALRNDLIKLPGVEDVSFSRSTIGVDDMGTTWGRGENGKYNFRAVQVDSHFLNVYGIPMVDGRNFRQGDKDKYIFNETFRKKYPEIELHDTPFDENGEVIGFCANFRVASARIDNQNLCCGIYLANDDADIDFLNWISIRIAANVNQFDVRNQIIDVTKNYTDDYLDYSFIDDKIEYAYRDELRFITQIRCFAVLTVIITLIGVFCLVMFENEYRRREIGIRKVMGAQTSEILIMFTRHYMWLLIASFIPAVPAAYMLGNKWLENFAEHIDIEWWVFAVSFVSVSVITIAIVIIKSWRSAACNPVDSIRA